MPPEQVPGELYVRRVLESAQSAPGGELQLTLAQGSLLHAAPLHPKGQVMSDDVALQTPPAQATDGYERRVVEFRQMAGGNVQPKV